MIKNYRLFGAVLLGVASLQLNAQNRPSGTTSNPSDTWEVMSDFSDEFNGNSIDWNKWSKSTNLPNTKAWKWNNNTNVKAVSYKGQKAAKIIARHNSNNALVGGTYFNSGCVQAKKQLPKNFVGYVEARIHGSQINAAAASGLDKQRGVCPSFWLYSDFFDNKPIGQAVYTEIDVVELQQFDYDVNAPAGVNKQDLIDDAESNLHLVKKASFGRDWFRPKQAKARANQLNKYHLGFDPSQNWHTYGCEITPTKLYFYIDGKRTGKVLDNTYWSSNPMKVIASLGMRVPFVSFAGNVFSAVNPVTNNRASKNLSEIPADMHVDYIRVWKKGNATNTGGGNNNGGNNGGNNTVSISPNPANTFVNVNAPTDSRVRIIRVSNNRTVRNVTILRNNKRRINIANLSSGIYNVRVISNGTTTNTRLVVN